MGDANYYRAQADFCEQMAATIGRPDGRDRWLRVAEQWRQLAEEVEHRQHNDGTQLNVRRYSARRFRRARTGARPGRPDSSCGQRCC